MKLLILLFLSIFTLTYSCPDAKKLYPCTCKMDGPKWMITCSNFHNGHDLHKALSVLKQSKKKAVFSITIEKSAFTYLPDDLFKEIKCAILILKSSVFMALSNSAKALAGLEKNLLALSFDNLDFMSEWRWNTIKHLKYLNIVSFSNNNMEAIRNDIKEMADTFVAHFHFINCGISRIDDDAFALFPKLVSMCISNNMVSEVKRSMFPNPAPKLKYLDFSYNDIYHLPFDLFLNMPALENIDLYHNQIATLSDKLLTPVWNHLNYFDVRENDISCDCRLQWMVNNKFPHETFIICSMPLPLKGRPIQDIKYEDILCEI